MVSPEQRKLEWDRAVTNIHKVCNLASERGLEIALEPLNRFESDLINTAEDVMRLIRMSIILGESLAGWISYGD